ncbi:MAG: hypothetical protein FWH06_07200 [Oscillospiraceae bacterium]|nr:hypothetical protein [Oscillospiraceae bacterium]
MRALRGCKGFYLIELLIALLLILFAMTLVSLTVMREIDKARGSMLTSEARSVGIAARQVIMESAAYGVWISDHDYEKGLAGNVNSLAEPVQTRLSERINALLAPEIKLAAEPGGGMSAARFVIKDGEIINLVYEGMIGDRRYAVTIGGGETTVERIRD